MSVPRIVRRTVPEAALAALLAAGEPPWLARLLAARVISCADDRSNSLEALPTFEALSRARETACVLADAIAADRSILIVADYDADGATACAVGVRALRMFGARVDYLVPDRFRFGYGLTPEIVALAAERRPDLLVTVDNGISSLEGVAAANRLGIPVLVTDHHLPGPTLPDALCIVNPNQPGCTFPSRHLAGVGVMFYVMLALRAELRARGKFAQSAGPKLGSLLDLVALGTVADVVRLDRINRVLVAHGVERMRRGGANAGIRALFAAAGRDPALARSQDLGFSLGPRLNAAGRLEDMSLGIECLITDDEERARAIATRLDELNRERRVIEATMRDQAFERIDAYDPGERYGAVLYDPAWHTGVVGLLAARVKDRMHRPTIVFARGQDGELRGSGRSIAALHLRDALERVAARCPGAIVRFGGHAAAAGLTLNERDLPRFEEAFENVLRETLGPSDLEQEIETDGELAPGALALETALRIEREVWGQGFPEPQFEGSFKVLDQRTVGGAHTRLRLGCGDRVLGAIRFGSVALEPARIDAVFRLGVDRWNGAQAPQLVIEHSRPAS